MTFNLTIIVQIVHFLIAYFILERVFFRPAIHTLLERDAEQQKKERMLEDQRNGVKVLERHTKEQAQQRQQTLLATAPDLHVQQPQEHLEPFYKEKQQHLTATAQERQEEESLTKVLEALLIRKIAS